MLLNPTHTNKLEKLLFPVQIQRHILQTTETSMDFMACILSGHKKDIVLCNRNCNTLMPTGLRLTALLLQKMPSAAELTSAALCLQERRSRKKCGSPESSSSGAGVKHFPLAFRSILVENKMERVLCSGRVIAMPIWLSFSFRRHPRSQVDQVVTLQPSSALGVR